MDSIKTNMHLGLAYLAVTLTISTNFETTVHLENNNN